MTSSPPYFFRMAQFDLTRFATRGSGRQVRHAMELALQELPAGERMVVDFTGIEDVTSAFVDEAIAKLMEAGPDRDHPNGRMVISGATDNIKTRLQMVFARRELTLDLLSFE